MLAARHFLRLFSSLLFALILSASLAACRSSPPASGNLAKATQMWREAEEAHGIDAPLDPVVDQIDQLTRRTPQDAADYEELRAFDAVLLQKRADRAAQIAREKKAREQQERALAEQQAAAPTPEAPDAGTAALPVVGSPAKDFLDRYGSCVKAEMPFLERGGTRQGTAYGRVESDDCKQKFPELEGQLVFVAEDKIFNVAPRGAGERIEVRAVDGGFAPVQPDAGR